jgi:hypothetical protein
VADSIIAELRGEGPADLRSPDVSRRLSWRVAVKPVVLPRAGAIAAGVSAHAGQIALAVFEQAEVAAVQAWADRAHRTMSTLRFPHLLAGEP